MITITRDAAIKLGKMRYFTGKPCKRGHIDERFCSTKICVSCNRINAKEYKIKKPFTEDKKKYHVLMAAKWAENNKEKIREHWRKYSKKRLKEKPYISAIKSAKRATAKLYRTPVWADITKIKEVYIEASKLKKETGVFYEVDHIIPLQGKNISGLHVHYNLQIITRRENAIKNNKFEVA